MIRGIFPMRDAAERKVGALFVVRDFTLRHAAVKNALREVRLRVLGVAMALSAVLYLALHWLVFARLNRLLRAARSLAVRLPGRALDSGGESIAGGDELSQLETLFERFRKSTGADERHPPRTGIEGDL